MILTNYVAFRHAFAPGAAPDVTGYPRWPSALPTLTIAGNVRPLVSLPLYLTCNGFATDSAGLPDLFDWYVSQRTDEQARQLLRAWAVPQRSGSLVLTLTDYGASTFALGQYGVGPISPEQVRAIFRHVDVYVRRRSDGAFGFLGVLDAALTEV